MNRLLTPTLVFVGLVVAVIGSLGAPLVPTVAARTGVSLTTAQWTLTATLLVGAVCTPVLGRLGDQQRRHHVIAATLGTVLAGSVLTVLPAADRPGGFALLLAGRVLQGVGLGLISLIIAVARDAYPPARSGQMIGLLSVTSVAGIGLGYPVAAVLTRFAGVRAAYAAGLAVVAAALVLAIVVLPPGPPRPARPVDLTGAALLGGALASLLYAVGEAASGVPLIVLCGLLLTAVGLGAAWIRRELRTPHPLVQLQLLRVPGVLAADLTVLLGGVGMYLLLAVITRYVQTPSSTGYGFDAGVIGAGLVLVPFSALSFVGGRIVPGWARHSPPPLVLGVSCAVVAVAAAAFALARDQLWQSFAVMGLAGAGVGAVFAAAPLFIVASVPPGETGSAVGFNQVLRTVGLSAGSALAGLILAAATPSGAVFPRDTGYTVAGLVAAGSLMLTAAAVATLRLRRRPGSPMPGSAQI